MLDVLAHFIEIAEAGSLTGAAARSGIPKTTLSRSLAQLEQRLGRRLVQRSPRAMTLTDAGERLYRDSVAAVRELGQNLQQVRGDVAAWRGRIRITAPQSFGRFLVAPVLQRFLALHPGLEIECSFSDAQLDLIEGGYDLALRLGALPSSALVARRLACVPRQLVAAPAFVARQGKAQVPQDLADLPAGAMTRAQAALSLEHISGETARLRLAVRLVAAPDMLADAVRSGQLLAALPRFLVQADLDSGTLIPLLADWQLPATPVALVLPNNKGQGAAQRALGEALHAACNERIAQGLLQAP
jgi:DNA-binding transcriptional LysR family regulator